MIGKTISHYKILAKLGEGSMGKVYKAEDTKLKRIVALKFLPHHLVAGKTVKQRFFHEARSASALNHPNIITIHDIHEEDGEVFIAMECVDGELLSDKLKDGPLKQKEVIDIASGIADGLNAAHNADITHRDIKSDNIIIGKEGQVKILDFGLAKQKGMSQITQDGTTLGTQAYMSPEQVQSSKVDKRSDIFSYGVVLYQMATGRLPFEGEHEAAVLYSIVNEAPIPTTTLNPNINEELQRIISKALEKNPKDRYQHADEILADLRKLKKGSTPKPTKAKAPIWRIPAYIFGVVLISIFIYSAFFNKKDDSIKSIAVLPFSSIDRTEESEIFCAGIHDDILTQISKISDLKVIARTSVMYYRNTDKKIKDIAKELGVNSILEGSVRRSGNRIRIVAQLINPETEDHIWAETYDREYSDIFTIQSDVANKIASSLQATLSIKEKQLIDEIPTKNLEAYECYQQGKIILDQGFGLENIKTGINLFKRAIELDPSFAEAYARLLHAQLRLAWRGFLSQNMLDSLKITLDKAKELNPNNPEVLFSEGYYYYMGYQDFEKAIQKFLQAIKIQPNNSEIIRAIGYVKRRQNKWDDAVKYFLQALDTDPKSFRLIAELGYTARLNGDLKLAEQMYERAGLINPTDIVYYIDKIDFEIDKGDLIESQNTLRNAMHHFDAYELIYIRAYLEYLNRNFDEALKISQEYRTNDGDLDIYDDWDKYTYSSISNFTDKAKYSRFGGKYGLTKAYCDSLVIRCKDRLEFNEDDFISRGWMALAYSYLGMETRALEETERVSNTNQVKKDFVRTIYWKYILVEIYIILNEFEKAISEIDYLLSHPSDLSVNLIKLDPMYDALRDNPRFQELIKKYEHTEG